MTGSCRVQFPIEPKGTNQLWLILPSSRFSSRELLVQYLRKARARAYLAFYWANPQQSHTPPSSLPLMSFHIKRLSSHSVVTLLPLNKSQCGLISLFFLTGISFSSEYTPTSLHLIGKTWNTNLSAGAWTFASLTPSTPLNVTGNRFVWSAAHRQNAVANKIDR